MKVRKSILVGSSRRLNMKYGHIKKELSFVSNSWLRMACLVLLSFKDSKSASSYKYTRLLLPVYGLIVRLVSKTSANSIIVPNMKSKETKR